MTPYKYILDFKMYSFILLVFRIIIFIYIPLIVLIILFNDNIDRC